MPKKSRQLSYQDSYDGDQYDVDRPSRFGKRDNKRYDRKKQAIQQARRRKHTSKGSWMNS